MIYKSSISAEDIVLMQTVRELMRDNKLNHSELINSLVSKIQVSLNDEDRIIYLSLIHDVWISQDISINDEQRDVAASLQYKASKKNGGPSDKKH